jgi:cell division protein FtsB
MSARAHAAQRYRARPTARTARRNPSRIRWDKLGRVVLVLVLLLVLASYINPIVNFVDAWRDSRAERAQLQQLQQQNQELHSKAGALSGPDSAEREARRLGMVAGDERSFVIK